MPTDKVFLDYTQEQLDQAYDQLYWAPQRDAIQAEIRESCEGVRQAMPPRTERYGKSDMQVSISLRLRAQPTHRCLSSYMAVPGCGAPGSMLPTRRPQ
jgi:hypothetical protein